MYELVADTCSQDLFIGLIKNDQCIDYIYVPNLLKKTDVFSNYVLKLLKQNDLTFKKVEAFYCTNGPGSFTGARTALTFFATLAQISNHKLLITDSLSFLTPHNFSGTITIDARSGLEYNSIFNQGKQVGSIKLQPVSQPFSHFQLKDFLKHSKTYLKRFSLVNNLLEIKVHYVKQPSIGGITK